MSDELNDPRVTAYLFGELEGEEKSAFERDMAESEALRRSVGETRNTIALLESDFSAAEPLRLSAAQRAVVEAQFMNRLPVNRSPANGGELAELSKSVDEFGVPTGNQARRHSSNNKWVQFLGGLSLVALASLVGAAMLLPGMSDRTPASGGGLEEGLANRSELMELSSRAASESQRELARAAVASGSGIEVAQEGEQNAAQRTWDSMWGGSTSEPASGRSPAGSLEGTDNAVQMMGSEVETDRDGDQSTGFETLGGSGGGGGLRGMGATEGRTIQVPEGNSRAVPAGQESETNDPFAQPRERLPAIPSFGISSELSKDVDGFRANQPRLESLQQLAEEEELVDLAAVAGDAVAGAPVAGGGVAGGGVAGGAVPESQLRRRLVEATRGGRRSAILDVGLSEITEDLSLAVSDRGRGVGFAGDRFDHIVENDFLQVTDAPLSTFSIDVDSASYAKVRMVLNQQRQLPRPDAVRIEELINYFPYDYEGPSYDGSGDGDPFAAHQDVVVCPWEPSHRLVRIGLKGREVENDARPRSNLVFLLDVSGSMDQPNKLPLLKRGMKMLTDELNENDRVAVVVYAGAAGLVLDSTTGDQKATIVGALSRLNAGGSTNGGAGIQLAYQMVLDHFIEGGVNRVILCTDGDFNVGTTGTDELVRLVERNAKAGVFISVLGFGMGNHNDSMLEQISNKGNGNYAFVDADSEARKVLVEQMAGTLVTIAKDVKIQVEFNPAKVAAYRLIGYENRVLAAQDFNNDKKDAGEIGAGHTVTALYEIVPADGADGGGPQVDRLKYQSPLRLTDEANGRELLTLKLRYKQPDGEVSRLLTFPLLDSSKPFHESDRDLQFAAAVASFGMLLRNSQHAGNANYATVLEMAGPAARVDESGYRQEFLQLVRKAASLSGR